MDLKLLWQNVQENVEFLLTCLLIFVGLFVVALLVEKLWLKPKQISAARRVAYIGIFSAIAAVLMYFEISVPFAPHFYQLDLSEVPVFICSFSLGPVAGVVCEFLKILLKLMIKGTSTAYVGDFANFFVGCALVLPASIIYHAKKTRKMAIIGLITGTAVMTIFGSFFNAVYMLPKFSQLFGMPMDVIIGMGTAVNGAINSVSTLVLFAVVPFNLLKGVLVSFLTLLLYKRVEKLFFRSKKQV